MFIATIDFKKYSEIADSGRLLAKLYEVEPRVLVQSVKRNKERFPEDFIFQLTTEEFENLKLQIVISSSGMVQATKLVKCVGLTPHTSYPTVGYILFVVCQGLTPK